MVLFGLVLLKQKNEDGDEVFGLHMAKKNEKFEKKKKICEKIVENILSDSVLCFLR